MDKKREMPIVAIEEEKHQETERVENEQDKY